jgi:tRNA pseudouridine38-40 synthase
LRFHVAYDGTDFSGWQVQPGLPTIQGTLEEIISNMEGKTVHVAASGRTDAGVHALAQVAAVSIENPIPVDNFRRAVNRLLPGSIRIFDVVEMDTSFHPRFDALRKSYEYRIFRDEIVPPFSRHYVYHHPYPLDEAAMIAAAPQFEGEHDFSAFAASDERDALGASKVRCVFRSSLSREDHLLIYRVTGSGFLKHMVRNMVGQLLEIGKRNVQLTELPARLQPGSEITPGPTAPARGLYLVSVEYE